MSAKATIVDVLGESELLLPQLVHDALAANGRAKYFFTLLQLARAHADGVDGSVRDIRRERELAGIADERLDAVIDGSHRGDDDEYRIPLAKTIATTVLDEIEVMLAPLRATTGSREALAEFERRLSALSSAALPRWEGAMTSENLALLTSSDREHLDSAHLLVLDLHKVIDAVAASIATANVDGAKTYGLDEADRRLVAAFMKGIRQTEALKFTHPGLGTMATRSGSKLIIENDIGETSAHVLIVHVEGLQLVVRSTDVHVRRLEFLRQMLDGNRLEWAEVRTRSAHALEEVGLFYECTGSFSAENVGELERFLLLLGSRIVFLIDWNRARKALRAFVSKKASLELLSWAAKEDNGHRGFLELGGEQLVFDAMAAAIRTPLRFGERLDDVLGGEGAAEFLRFVLGTTSAGLRAGRSRPLMRAEIHAALAQAVRRGGERLLEPAAEHAAIVASLASEVRDQLRALHGALAMDRNVAARTARERERRGDDLVNTLRDAALRMPDAADYRSVVEFADDAADNLEEAVFVASLLPERLPTAAFPAEALDKLGDLVVATAQAYMTCVASARSASAEEHVRMLGAVDAIATLEHEMDEAERAFTAALAREPAVDGKLFALATRVSSELENAVDALTHAAFALRSRVTR